jgi:hypothetical protein
VRPREELDERHGRGLVGVEHARAQELGVPHDLRPGEQGAHEGLEEGRVLERDCQQGDLAPPALAELRGQLLGAAAVLRLEAHELARRQVLLEGQVQEAEARIAPARQEAALVADLREEARCGYALPADLREQRLDHRRDRVDAGDDAVLLGVHPPGERLQDAPCLLGREADGDVLGAAPVLEQHVDALVVELGAALRQAFAPALDAVAVHEAHGGEQERVARQRDDAPDAQVGLAQALDQAVGLALDLGARRRGVGEERALDRAEPVAHERLGLLEVERRELELQELALERHARRVAREPARDDEAAVVARGQRVLDRTHDRGAGLLVRDLVESIEQEQDPAALEQPARERPGRDRGRAQARRRLGLALGAGARAPRLDQVLDAALAAARVAERHEEGQHVRRQAEVLAGLPRDPEVHALELGRLARARMAEDHEAAAPLALGALEGGGQGDAARWRGAVLDVGRERTAAFHGLRAETERHRDEQVLQAQRRAHARLEARQHDLLEALGGARDEALDLGVHPGIEERTRLDPARPLAALPSPILQGLVHGHLQAVVLEAPRRLRDPRLELVETHLLGPSVLPFVAGVWVELAVEHEHQALAARRRVVLDLRDRLPVVPGRFPAAPPGEDADQHVAPGQHLEALLDRRQRVGLEALHADRLHARGLDGLRHELPAPCVVEIGRGDEDAGRSGHRRGGVEEAVYGTRAADRHRSLRPPELAPVAPGDSRSSCDQALLAREE